MPGTIAAGGQATLTITAEILDGGSLRNSAQVTAAPSGDIDSTPNNGTGPVPVEDDEASATVSSKVTDLAVVGEIRPTGGATGAPYRYGDTVQLVVTITNNGPDAATGVTVADPIPSGFSYVGDDSAGRYDPATGTWSVGDIPVGECRSLIITATVNPTGSWTNEPSLADLDQTDTASTNNADSDSIVPAPLSLGNRVWLDADNDGVQDVGETGIANVAVRLIRADGTVAGTTTTNATGHYLFGGLAPGDYTVEITAPAGHLSSTGAGSGYEPAPDPDGNVDLDDNGTTNGTVIRSAPVTLRGGEPTGEALTTGLTDTATDADSNLTVDFGLFQPASLSGVAWRDSDGDGTNDTGEPILAGVTVTLVDPTGATVATSTTGSDGTYSFGGLAPGTYQVRFTAPAGLRPSAANEGDDTTDSDADVVTGLTAPIALVSGANVADNDAGFFQPATLGGLVWNDADNDGVTDPTETPIAGTEIVLSGIDGAGNTVRLVTTTAADGTYQFTNVAPGTYTVSETQPIGYLDGDDRVGDQGGTLGNDLISGITLSEGETGTGYAFGEITPARVAGYVWNDLDDDGIQDANEPGISGVAITLTGTDDQGDPVSLTVTTGADGSYAFENLRPGTYTLTQTQPDGYGDGKDGAGGTGGTPGNDTVTAIVLGAGATATGYRFGEIGADLGDVVFRDTDGDGIQDAGEPGISGVTVIVRDQNGTEVARTTTDANGTYTITGLPAGTYTVEVVPSSLPAGVTPTTDLDGVATPNRALVMLVAGQNRTDVDFGYRPPATTPTTNPTPGISTSSPAVPASVTAASTGTGTIVAGLSATGSNAASLVRLSLQLVAAGLFLVLATRRARRRVLPSTDVARGPQPTERGGALTVDGGQRHAHDEVVSELRGEPDPARGRRRSTPGHHPDHATRNPIDDVANWLH